eukprot:scaffold8195_cov156-Amphora_coffeaeformis.AAC.4
MNYILVVDAYNRSTIVVPQWFKNGNFLDCPSIESDAVRGVCDAAVLTLGTGYAIGCLVALVLNGVLPNEDEDATDDPEMTTKMITKSAADSSSEDYKKSAEEASEEEA